MSEPEFDVDVVRPGSTSTVKVGFFSKTSTRAVAAALLLVMLCASISAGVAFQFQRRTVVFNMKGTIDLFMQQSAKKQLDENSARVITARFNQALDESLVAWQQKHDDLILVPGAVVMPSQDITPQIQTDVARRMQESP